MGKRKLKKIKRIVSLVMCITIYIFLIISLIAASYCMFNLRKFYIDQTFMISLLSMPFIIGASIYLGSNYKQAQKIFDDFYGFIVALPLILTLMTTCSFFYKSIRIKKIDSENEHIFDQYTYYIDFDLENGKYNYRIDEATENLYHIDLENHRIIEYKPIYLKDLNEDYLFEVYKIHNGYVIFNNKKGYFTKSLNKDSKLYNIDFPVDDILKNYTSQDYYKIKGKKFNFINKTYASEENETRLYLFKKYNDIFYTKEKIYDLRIQMQNNFNEYPNIQYITDYIKIKINNNYYKIKFTFDEQLNVIYSKEEI